MRGALEDSDDPNDITEDERKRIRHQAHKVAKHVADVLSEHVRGGGSAGKIKERSLDAQAEMIPDDAPADERKLSTIDAAARAVNARDFQRKIDMLMKYKEYMSPARNTNWRNFARSFWMVQTNAGSFGGMKDTRTASVASC